jgi:hypothetical protein
MQAALSGVEKLVTGFVAFVKKESFPSELFSKNQRRLHHLSKDI